MGEWGQWAAIVFVMSMAALAGLQFIEGNTAFGIAIIALVAWLICVGAALTMLVKRLDRL